jgi:hypothetical protein
MTKNMKLLIIILPLALCQCTDGVPGEVVVAKKEFKGDWPFPGAEVATISCAPGTRSVLVKLNGTVYGLNGDALGRDYPDARVQMGKDEYGGYKLGDYRKLVDQGLTLCDRNG